MKRVQLGAAPRTAAAAAAGAAAAAATAATVTVTTTSGHVLTMSEFISGFGMITTHVYLSISTYNMLMLRD